MENHPDFQRDIDGVSMDELREKANKRHMLVWNEDFYSINDVSFEKRNPQDS